jgi:hypothetical protein
MIETYKQRIPFEKFLQDGFSFSPVNRADYISYKEFVKYFADLKTITKHNLIIGINFTYGWMPTIFEFCSDNFDESLNILNRAKKGKIPKIEHLGILKNLFNNSMVGTSKLLHFINPEIFAIWDSRVYRYLTGKSAYDYRINDYAAYLSYLKFCDYLTSHPDFGIVHKAICDLVGYSMTKFRTAELVMYSAGGSKR